MNGLMQKQNWCYWMHMICMIQRIFFRTINRLYLFIYLFQYCKSKIISSRNNITSLLFTLMQPPFSEQCLVTWTIISWKDDHGHFQKSGMIMDTSSVFFFFFQENLEFLILVFPFQRIISWRHKSVIKNWSILLEKWTVCSQLPDLDTGYISVKTVTDTYFLLL